MVQMPAGIPVETMAIGSCRCMSEQRPLCSGISRIRFERLGALLQAYDRISEKELRKHCPVVQPDIVIVADFTLLEGIDVFACAYERSAFLINAGTSKRLKRSSRSSPVKNPMWLTVDGTRIALGTIGRPLPNSPLVGALAKISGLVEMDIIADDVAGRFDKKLPRKIIKGNGNAVKRG
jgi:pyruvate ferredoxin oxidoreductase gamma subunit